jgi:hypothetical protein
MQRAVTDDELSGLSAEERAALSDPEAISEEEAAIAQAAADAAAEEAAEKKARDDAAAAAAAEAAAMKKADEEGAASDDVAKAAAAEAAAAEAAAKAAGEVEGAATAAGEEDEPFVPRYQAAGVVDFKEKMEALDKKFEDGEINLKEYNNTRDVLNRQQLKAEIAAEQDQQIDQQRWDWEIKRFIRDTAKNEGIDYNKPLLNAALDMAVKNLANAKDATGNLINGTKDGEWFLTEADKLVRAEFGIAAKPAATEKLDKDGKPIVEKPALKPRKVPTTLSQIPSTQVEEASPADPFAYIDKLFEQGKVEAGEMALRKLSKTDADSYLRSR